MRLWTTLFILVVGCLVAVNTFAQRNTANKKPFVGRFPKDGRQPRWNLDGSGICHRQPADGRGEGRRILQGVGEPGWRCHKRQCDRDDFPTVCEGLRGVDASPFQSRAEAVGHSPQPLPWQDSVPRSPTELAVVAVESARWQTVLVKVVLERW